MSAPAGPEVRTRELHPGHGDVDAAVAIAEETSRTLGLAGDALAEAVTAYRAAQAAPDLPPAEVERCFEAVVAALYRLRLQRECAGARSGNLDAIAAAYDVPAAALLHV